MSRHRSRTALTATTTGEVERAIRELHAIMQSTVQQPSITHDDLLAMFAPPEAVEIFKTAPALAAVSHYYADSSFDYVFNKEGNSRVCVHFQLNGDRKSLPMVPKNPVLQDGHIERAFEIMHWGGECVDLAFDWGLVYRLFNVLNTTCTSPQQLRYVFPPLLGLMRTRGSLDEQVAALEEFKRPAKLPSLPADFREVSHRCAQIITTALIMRDVVPADDNATALVDMTATPAETTRPHTCPMVGSYTAMSR